MAVPSRLASVEAALGWLQARGVQSLSVDSRCIGAGSAFIAWPGHAVDGRQFVAEALAAGAVAALVEDDGAAAFAFDAGRVASVVGLKAMTGEIASRLLGEPSRRLRVVACTGTNGKTSMAWWTAQALSHLGQRCGVVGTLGVGEPPLGEQPGSIVATGLTTPDPVGLQMALRRFVDAGFRACALEASSIGIVEHRLAGTGVEIALFSNFTQDHLDFHGSMEAYWQAKAQLFRWPGLKAAAINLDDAQGRRLAGELASAGVALDCWTYSASGPARLMATNRGYRDGGLSFDVVESFEVVESGGASVGAGTGDRSTETRTVATRLIGSYNVSNLLAVIGGLRALGVPLAAAAAACSRLTPVPGRMQRLPQGQDEPAVVVDYAHTPDALEQALRALQPFADERGGRLWCVFGCGGNRDAAKRPVMGAIAARLAQRVVVTSDNPRHESPSAIIEQVVAGIGGSGSGGSAGPRTTADTDVSDDAGAGLRSAAGKPGAVMAIENRAVAIATAIREAASHDVILIAGKGHETTQDIAGRKLPFADADEAVAALRERAGVVA